MVKKYSNFILQLESAAAVALSESAIKSLVKKSERSNIPIDILEKVYIRGYSIWNESFNQTAEQFAFDRVNSFIAGGFAMALDNDLVEGKRGLWDNIHAKRERIKGGSGEKMRKPGSEGAPTNAAIKASQNEESDPCWKGYNQIGMKMKGGKKVPNCVPVKEEDERSWDNRVDSQRRERAVRQIGNRMTRSARHEPSQIEKDKNKWTNDVIKSPRNPTDHTKRLSAAHYNDMFSRERARENETGRVNAQIRSPAPIAGQIDARTGKAPEPTKYTSVPTSGEVSQSDLNAGKHDRELKKERNSLAEADGKDLDKVRKITSWLKSGAEVDKETKKPILKLPNVDDLPTELKMFKIKESEEARSKDMNDPASRFVGSDELVNIYKQQTPGQSSTTKTIKKVVKEAIEESNLRAKHKSPSGGLTQAGRDYYNRTAGANLQAPVTTKPSKLKKGSKAANRRKSFCARMGGMKKRLTSAKTANDPDSRINKALRKWNC